ASSGCLCQHRHSFASVEDTT
ncbi:hypothetical protein V3C99_000548, partial [Haemonchus contortus]